jgi:hypothetical protein
MFKLFLVKEILLRRHVKHFEEKIMVVPKKVSAQESGKIKEVSADGASKNTEVKYDEKNMKSADGNLSIKKQ